MLGYVIGAFLNGHVWGTPFKLEEMHILFSYFFNRFDARAGIILNVSYKLVHID